MRFRTALIPFLFLMPILAIAQALNDECNFGEYLGEIENYCSGAAEFSNVGATASPEAAPMCFFDDAPHDVWFSFRPLAEGAYLSIIGNLRTPNIAVYEGFCGNLQEIGCGSISAGTFTEVSVFDLIINELYYVRVDARDANQGSFQLCIETFSPTRLPESDCRDAVVLCDKSAISVENLNSTGSVQNELTGPCVLPGQDGEKASVWYVWTCDQPGTLEMTLTPNNPNNDEEDLDWVVYELPGGLQDCDNRQALRCMLSGETQGLPSSPCYGPTGMVAGETDTQEFAGCQDGSNNFTSPIDMQAGVSYGLIVNNFSQSGFGFSLDWGGTGTFLGPEADFEVDATVEFECDKTILFTDLSQSLTDPIESYRWNLGAGADPLRSNASSFPLEVTYETFGHKVVALTVETTRGCLVTVTKDFFIDACCADTSDLALAVEAFDISCPGEIDGQVVAGAEGGFPLYQYSLNGGEFTPNALFPNLPEGQYEVTIQDSKGCLLTEVVDIEDPVSNLVDAGPDRELLLGDCINLEGEIVNASGVDSFYWSVNGILADTINTLDEMIQPPGTSTFTLTVIDDNGCVVSDEVFFDVEIVRPIDWPNIFSPNGDFRNEFFNLYSDSKAVRGIEELQIFDRWGNLVYNGRPEINNPNDGWNGLFGNNEVEIGVYVFRAVVSFVDNVEVTYAGDITVVRR